MLTSFRPMHCAPALLLALGLFAFSATNAADDYVFSYSTAPYVPLVDPIVVVTDEEFNGTYRYVPIGFYFDYWGDSNTIFTFNTHGYCAFGFAPNYGFYPFNVGLVGIGDSQVGYVQDLSGGPGHGILKVEWKHVGFYSYPSGEDHVSWQVWLYEGSNAVELHFGPSAIASGHYAGIFGSANGPQTEFIHPEGDGFYDLEGPADAPAAVYMPGENIFLQGYPGQGMVYRFMPTTSIGVAEVNGADQTMVLYPQPASTVLHVAHGDGSAISGRYTISDVAGHVVQHGRMSANGLDVSSLSVGTYILRTTEAGLTRQRRFVRAAR
ncbi:MAG: T9SS type A sorting domain-containing protein [Flavobacteriales bacterium]|nr:T9SS type A sorting domain-containing protein [Flavobacteriales bacterium]